MPSFKKTGLLTAAALLYLVVIIAFLGTPKPDIYNTLARLFALLGIVTLYLAAMTSVLGPWIWAIFGRSSKTIHHWLSISGIVLISLHPVTQLLQNLDFGIFLPSFDSLQVFLELAGRPALILIYVALAAVLLRKSIPRYWRAFHVLTYIALIFGIIHGMLIGSDTQSTVMKILLEAMGTSLIAAFIFKRLRRTN